MSDLGGYGRGWREQKAAGWMERFWQIMREPATKTSYLVAFGGMAAGIVLIQLFL